jgi:hypothetical protein
MASSARCKTISRSRLTPSVRSRKVGANPLYRLRLQILAHFWLALLLSLPLQTSQRTTRSASSTSSSQRERARPQGTQDLQGTSIQEPGVGCHAVLRKATLSAATATVDRGKSPSPSCHPFPFPDGLKQFYIGADEQLVVHIRVNSPNHFSYCGQNILLTCGSL